MTQNKIDLQTNNYLSKNNNFLPSAPPKHNINLLKNENFSNFVLQLRNNMYIENDIENHEDIEFNHYLSKNINFLPCSPLKI